MRCPGYLTFWEMARELAKKRHEDNWLNFCGGCFDEVNYDFWDRLFADHNGPKRIFSLSVGAGPAPETITPDPRTSPNPVYEREFVWGLLGVGRPAAFNQYWDHTYPPWNELAKVPTEDYGDGARDTLKKLCLLEGDARAWIEARLRDGPLYGPMTLAERAKLRVDLKAWIEETAEKQSPATYTKQDFYKDAMKKMRGGRKITQYLFDGVWPKADIAEEFRKPGRRRNPTN